MDENKLGASLSQPLSINNQSLRFIDTYQEFLSPKNTN